MIYETLWKHVNTCSHCSDTVQYNDAIVNTSNELYHRSCATYEYKKCDEPTVLALFNKQANISNVIEVYQELENLPELHVLDALLKLERLGYYPTTRQVDFDAWSYGIFRGFDWTGFTVKADEIGNFQANISFVLWSPYYGEMRERMKYFYEFVADRLQMSVTDIVTTVSSNLLQIFIPGFMRKVTLFIIYCNMMDTNIDGYSCLLHNKIIFLNSQNSTSPISVHNETLHYTETPEEFHQRTGLAAVTLDYLLQEIYPNWTLVCDIARGDYTTMHILQTISKKYSKYIRCNINHVSHTESTRVYIRSSIRSAKYKSIITPKRILDFILSVVYTQRTLQK